jgi:hypothetical protein
MRSTYLLTFVLLLSSFIVSAQTDFDPAKYDPPYTLSAPQGWDVERVAIPIEFAPSIPYKGVEDVRFTPGWGKSNTNEYWSYAFLWYLEGKPTMTSQIIEKNLAAYYTGLIDRNIEPRKIPKDKLFPVKVTIRKTTADQGDLETYSGTIHMLDYMEQKPMTLNCIVHVKSCPGKTNNTFMFHQISPRPLTNAVWTDLKKLWTSFDCNAAK